MIQDWAERSYRIFLSWITTNITVYQRYNSIFHTRGSGHQSSFILSKSVLTTEFWSVICRGMSVFGRGLFSHWNSHCCDPSNSNSLYTYLKPILHEKVWCCRIILTVARQDINGPCCLSLNRLQNIPWIKWKISIGPENSKQRHWYQ